MTPQLYTDSYFPLSCLSNAKSSINFDPLSNLHQVFLKKTLCQLRIRIFISGWLLLPFDFVKTIQKGNLNFDSQCNLQQDFLKKNSLSTQDHNFHFRWLPHSRMTPSSFWLLTFTNSDLTIWHPLRWKGCVIIHFLKFGRSHFFENFDPKMTKWCQGYQNDPWLEIYRSSITYF